MTPRSGPFNPLLSVGLLFRPGPTGGFLGSTFAFRDAHHFLTAQHCVRDLDPQTLGILMPRHSENFFRIAAVVPHPAADIAVLRIDPTATVDVEPFWNVVSNWSLGEDFIAYGYPEGRPGAGTSPTPRLFKGHYQRFMEHESHMGYVYLAGELSIGVPVGLSGGPLFRQGAPQMVTALVTENMASQLVEDSIEERSVDGRVVKTTLRQNVIAYGVAVMLSPIADWIDEQVPGRSIGR